MSKKARSRGADVDLLQLDTCSAAELATIARSAGYDAANIMHGKEKLVRIILGEEPPPEDPVAEERARIGAFVSKNRRLINQSLLSCDLNCAECPAMKVAECFVVNKEKL